MCLWLLLGRGTLQVHPRQEWLRKLKVPVEEAGLNALLQFLYQSVSKDADLDYPTRQLLLAFLNDELPVQLTLTRQGGRPAKVPEADILDAMSKELAAGGNLESAYAAAKEEHGVSRSRAQQVAQKHKLRSAGGATKPR
jgi:hypothetical protein